MKIMGFESTAHTFGCGIYDFNKKLILSNELSTFKPKNQGIIPIKASLHHQKNAKKIIKKALKKANLKISDIDVFSYARGPGIGQCLYSAYSIASYLSKKYKKKLIPIHHGASHILVGINEFNLKDPICIYVSGANTQILIKKTKIKKNHFYPMGETLDIGIGNLFDCFAREIGLTYAHGFFLEQMAKKGKYIKLPYTIKGTHFSFSGLLTNVIKKYKNNENVYDLTHSLLKTAFIEVLESCERILCLFNKKEILICGGVAQNKDFSKMTKQMAKKYKAKVYCMPKKLNRDNGAMIAVCASFVLNKKFTNFYPNPKYRIDDFYF